MKTLGELCNIVSGGTPLRSKTEFWDGGTIPWIKISNIKEKYVSEADEFITEEGLLGSSAKMLNKGTVLYTIFATLGEVGILKINACTNQAIAGLTIKDPTKLSTDYLYYYLKSKKSYVNSIGRGVAQNNINMTLLKKFVIPLPNLLKQNEIVGVLDNVSNIIDIHQKELKYLDELVKARFIEMFGTPFINEKKWELTQIKNIITDVRYGTSKPSTETGKYKYLRMNNLTSTGRIDLTNIKYIDLEGQELEKCLVHKGDILFNRTNSIDLIGKTADFDLDEDMVIAGYIIRVRLKDNILPKFFSMYFNTYEMKKYLSSIAKGAVNQANINAQELQAINIFLPPIELQNEFADFVREVDKSRYVSGFYKYIKHK